MNILVLVGTILDDISANATQPSNNSVINRSESTLFSVRVFDVDNQTYPNGTAQASGKVEITIYDLVTWEASAVSAVDAEGGWLNRTITTPEWCLATDKYVLGNHF